MMLEMKRKLAKQPPTLSGQLLREGLGFNFVLEDAVSIKQGERMILE